MKRRKVSVAHVEHCTSAGTQARSELDTRADTSCGGKNFWLDELTGQTCSVSPFSASYDPMTDVQIATCLTAYTDEYGRTWVLVFNEVLWFGSSMDHLLINPNQIRMTGTPVSDDPFDATRKLGIAHEKVFIPFSTDGTTVYFDTRVPTQREMTECTRIVMTGDTEWDPLSVRLESVRTKEEEDSRMICEIARQPPAHEFKIDHIMGDLGDVFVERSMTERLVANINVRQVSQVNEVVSKTRHLAITPEEVSRKFNIGIEKAKQTLKVTTQLGIRHAVHPLHQRYRVDHLNPNRKRLNAQFYTDHLVAKTKSLDGNTGAWVYTTGKFTAVYPCALQSEAGDTLKKFADDHGIPDRLRADLAPEITGKHKEFQAQVKRQKINLTFSEKGRSNQNYAAEAEIGHLKRRFCQKMVSKRVPKRVWDYGLVNQAGILSRISRGDTGRTGVEEVTGQTPDISEWLDFDFYDQVWWLDEKHPATTDENIILGRWLGISHKIGSDMCYWILTVSGKIIARTTVQHVTREDLLDQHLGDKIKEFDKALEIRMDDTNFVNDKGDDFYINDIKEADEAAHGNGSNTPTDKEYGDMLTEDCPKQDDIDDAAYDKYIGAEVMMDVPGEGPRRATVKRRVEDLEGKKAGSYHRNPMMDTREYELEYDDGTHDRYFANVIAENLYSQVDSEGHQFLVLDEISDHRSDGTAILVADGFTVSRNGNRIPKKTTRGWQLLTQMKEGVSEWIALKDLKDSNPVELAEYAVANKIDHEPAFAWWVPFTLRKRNRIVSKMQKKYWRTSHKFGIEVPTTLRRAYEIDEDTGTDFWQKATAKEMTKVKVAYEEKEETPEQVRSGEATGYIGYQEITCHLVFDVKMDFSRKARLVVNGAKTEAPAALTYSSVVSRDSVRLAFLIAELNDLDVMACDIGNAYLNAPCREKIWFKAGPEHGDKCGKVMVIVRALYGLKSSGAAWRTMLAQTVREMEFVPTVADPDVYRRRMKKPTGEDYYKLLLVYVDDILCISHNPQLIMDTLGGGRTI